MAKPDQPISSPPSKHLLASFLQSEDMIWIFSLFGTAIGAGVLFLPINAGMGGVWTLLLVTLLAFPTTYLSHRGLCRLVLSGHAEKSDITTVVDDYFGHTAGKIITFLYFFAIYPILLMYSIALTNTTHNFLEHQLHINPPSRFILAFALIFILMFIARFGQNIIIKTMSLLVIPFIAVLFFIALYLIPHWSLNFFSHADLPMFSSNISVGIPPHSLSVDLWLVIPVMVFAFNHSPIISSFAASQKKRFQNYEKIAEKKCAFILKCSHILMVVTVMFFVFSCVLSLSPADLREAKQQNITILSYLSNHFHAPFIAYGAPIIALVAISKSFLGHYLGASEGLRGFLLKSSFGRHHGWATANKQKKMIFFIDVFFIITCAIAAGFNFSILGMIESLGGPVIAVILFLLPLYALYKVPTMKKYRNMPLDLFTGVVGIIAISAILYKFFH